MKHVFSIGNMMCAAIVVATVSAGEAQADSDGKYDYTFGLAATIGEGMYFMDGDVYRAPVTLEAVPSIGWSWFKFDLGVSTRLESVEIAGTNVGNWNFTFRPGGRLTPPMMPLYLRMAFPLEIQQHDFDWGVMFGVGLDIPIILILGFVFEIDTILSKDLEWGGAGIPLEFRLGISLHF